MEILADLSLCRASRPESGSYEKALGKREGDLKIYAKFKISGKKDQNRATGKISRKRKVGIANREPSSFKKTN